jgi:PAS domain S-box-containing protein
MAVDITDRKHAEEGLRKSEEKFSKAFRESPMALTLTSAQDHRYLDVNETFEKISGWQREEVIGRTPFDIRIWVTPQERIEFVKRLKTEGSVRNYEVQFKCKDVTERLGLGSAELIEIDNEPCIISVIADVTESKQAQEKLRESQERLSGVISSAMDAIIAIDEQQRIVLFNAAAERMFGCAAADALQTPIERFIPERVRGNMPAI